MSLLLDPVPAQSQAPLERDESARLPGGGGMNPSAEPARSCAAANIGLAAGPVPGPPSPIEAGTGEAPWPVADLRAFLLGSWTLDRVILDRSRAMTGALEGEARFSPCAGGLLYEEHGILTLGEHRGRAERSYLYLFPEGGGRASVRFRDGRPFHELDLSCGEDRVSHPCRLDLYEGLFTVLGPAWWQSEWKASGPRKDYVLLTTYSR